MGGGVKSTFLAEEATTTTETIDLTTLEGSYEITQPGTYTFKGTYAGTPTFEDPTNTTRKAVIYVHPNLDNVIIVLNNAKIELSDSWQCPILVRDASKVTVRLAGENSLITSNINGQSPALWAPEEDGAELIIESLQEESSLYAEGAKWWPAIGIYWEKGEGSKITIKSGTIIAEGGGKLFGTGIGVSEGSNGYKGTIEIAGGNVLARGYSFGWGLGGRPGVGNILITGGVVSAIAGNHSNNPSGIGGSFSTGENGTAIIFASSITDQTGKTNNTWSGLIFEGDAGKLYGNNYELTQDLVLPEEKSLTVESGQTLKVPAGVTLTGLIVNNGTVLNEGVIIRPDGTKVIDVTYGSVNILESGSYMITGTTTTNTIKVNPGVTATITLKDVNIDVSNGLTCAFDMHGESLNPTKVELILEGTNTLKSGLASTPITSSTWHDASTTGYAGIFTGKYGDLTIKGEGTLNVDGGERGAAIGGCNSLLAPEGTAAIDYTHGGTIRIESGIINACAGRWGSGIGDGDYKGDVDVSESARVIITGGTITITGIADLACCFGHGSENNVAGGYVLISGGNFSLPEGVRIFRSETAIISEKAMINGGNQKIYSNGILYTEKTATQKGDVTLDADFENIAGSTLIIPVGATLTIPSDVSLTNNGTIILRGDINDITRVSNTGTIIRQTRLTAEMVEKSDDSFVYDGNPKTFTTVKVKNGTSGYYTQDTDYSVSYEENINAGDNTAVLKITSIPSVTEGALCGEVTIPFSIAKAAAPTIAAFNLISPIEYNGQPVEITAPVVTGVNLSNVPATLYYKLTAAENDTYTKTAPTEAGAYTVKAVCESPNHEEATAQTTTFNITKATTNGWANELATTTFAYGTNGYPTATATFGEVEYTYYKLNDDGTTYTKCDQPTDVGTWYITAKVTETGSYPGLTETDKVSFTINKATNNAWTTQLSDVATPWTYGEDGNYPTAEAKYGTVLYKYYDYDAVNAQYIEVSGKPINVGTWYVKAYVNETENFNGVPESSYASYTITARPLIASMVTLSSEEYTYNGYKPTLTVKHGVTTLLENTDYTVTWPDNAAGVGTHTVTIAGQGNFTGSIAKTYTVNARPYIPPTPDPDPVYYTVTIPTEVTGAIIHGGGAHEVEEYTYYTFRIELDPNGNGEYPTVTKGYWWDTLTPDGQGNYRVYVTGNTQIKIGEVPTNSYLYYQVTLPTDSVTEAENQYWSGDYIEVIGASPLRAAEEASISYQAPFGATVTLRPIETERRKFLMWEDGSTQKERTLTLRTDQEIKALWKRISPTGIEAIADGSVIRGERGQLYIEVPEPCDVTLYTYGGVPVRVARLAAGANRLANLNAGLYLVKIGAAPAVPVRVR